MMKRVSKVLAGGVAIASLSFLAPSHSAAPVIPTARIVGNGTQLALRWSGRKTTVNASSLNAQIIEGLDCTKGAIAPRQTLSGKKFFGNQALSIDPLTGNVAVGVVLQDCFDTFTSAVFVIDPQSPGTYAVYRVPVPGTTALPDEFSTFPLNAIRIWYLDGDLLIKQGSTAISSEALLVFTPGTTPAGQYAGCIVTDQGDARRNLCPKHSGN